VNLVISQNVQNSPKITLLLEMSPDVAARCRIDR